MTEYFNDNPNPLSPSPLQKRTPTYGWNISQIYHTYVGKYAWWHVKLVNRTTPALIMVPVKILEARMSWGKANLLIQPIMGQGTVWVRAHLVDVVRSKEELEDQADEEIKDAVYADEPDL